MPHPTIPCDPRPSARRLTAGHEEFDRLAERACADEWLSERCTIEPGGACVVLRGEADMAALSELDAVLRAMEDERPAVLEVELSGASFVSTAVMLRIIDSSRHVAHVAIRGASTTTRRIFRVLDPERRCELVD